MKCGVFMIVLGLLVAGQGYSVGQIVRSNRQYPRFQVGVTGIWATIEPGLAVMVDSAEPGRRFGRFVQCR